MNPLFDEKAEQVSPNILIAFGITLHSRYGKAMELSQMLDFASSVAWVGHEKLVKELFYDSKACLCTFEFTHKIKIGEPIEIELLSIAKKTIGQFMWIDDCVYHKDGTEDEFDM